MEVIRTPSETAVEGTRNDDPGGARLTAAFGDPRALQADRRHEFERLIHRFVEPDAAADWLRLFRYPDYLERRLRRYERKFRQLMAADVLSDAHRARVLALIHGAGGPARDAKTLEPAELRIVEQFRTLSHAEQQAVRTLLDNLASRPR